MLSTSLFMFQINCCGIDTTRTEKFCGRFYQQSFQSNASRLLVDKKFYGVKNVRGIFIPTNNIP